MILIVNDDVIFDVGSIDKAIECLLTEPKAGLIGGRLRDLNFNRLSHAGIVFDHRNSPYHQLDRLVQADSQTVLGDKMDFHGIFCTKWGHFGVRF